MSQAQRVVKAVEALDREAADDEAAAAASELSKLL